MSDVFDDEIDELFGFFGFLPEKKDVYIRTLAV
jgi:hypothetical protein